jgi:predicted small secreted protein
MHNVEIRPPRRSRRRVAGLVAALAALALGLGACSTSGGAGIPTDIASLELPTFPPDDLATGTAACIDAPTMAIIDQLRATGADVPALLAANKAALMAGLEDLDSADPATVDWRDAFLTALDSGDLDAAAAQVAVLAAGDLTITPC